MKAKSVILTVTAQKYFQGEAIAKAEVAKLFQCQESSLTAELVDSVAEWADDYGYSEGDRTLISWDLTFEVSLRS